METKEVLWLIFADSFSANLIFMFASEYVVWIAPKLTNINYQTIMLPYAAAIMLSNTCNFLFGMVVGNIFKTVGGEKVIYNSNNFKEIFSRYGYIFFLLAFIPFVGKFIVFLSGFNRHKIISSIVLCSLYSLTHYIINI